MSDSQDGVDIEMRSVSGDSSHNISSSNNNDNNNGNNSSNKSTNKAKQKQKQQQKRTTSTPTAASTSASAARFDDSKTATAVIPKSQSASLRKRTVLGSAPHNAPDYVAVGAVFYSASVVLCFSALASESWIEREADRENYTEQQGKDPLQWGLIAAAAAVGVAGLICMMHVMWDRVSHKLQKRLWLAAVVLGVVETALMYTAWKTFRDENGLVELHPNRDVRYGVGSGLTMGTYLAGMFAFLLLAFHTHKHLDDHTMFMLNSNQKQMVGLTLLFFVYMQLGALWFEFIEDWNFRVAAQFCLITLTSIGYGNRTPTTTVGRASLFVYAPIGLIIIAYTFRQVWITVLSAIEKERQDRQEKHLTRQQTLTNLARRNRDARRKSIKIFICFLIECVAGAVLFYASGEKTIDDAGNETKWTFFECFYCSFITLTTIGYGDFAPVTTNLFLFTVYILFGIATLNMGVYIVGKQAIQNAMQDQIGGEDDALHKVAQARSAAFKRVKAVHEAMANPLTPDVQDDLKVRVAQLTEALSSLGESLKEWQLQREHYESVQESMAGGGLDNFDIDDSKSP
eukprot:TRINITY_DN65950_c4_g1_i1.p1 TRINITY_DN65950_c4_g1~~TRINITY_DN65950_c4_g1_i1.p1  ORF type:complete len:587 (-),score=273.93 TRINITY_DN65950_c4_g1_i1:85-1794(-)